MNLLVRKAQRLRDLVQRDLGDRDPCQGALECSQREAAAGDKLCLAHVKRGKAATNEVRIRRSGVAPGPPSLLGNEEGAVCRKTPAEKASTRRVP